VDQNASCSFWESEEGKNMKENQKTLGRTYAGDVTRLSQAHRAETVLGWTKKKGQNRRAVFLKNDKRFP